MAEKRTPNMDMTVDGSPADIAIVESIITVRVHQHLEQADTIEVRLSNNELDWTDGKTFVEGVKIGIKLGYEETEMVQVCEGEIVRRDCEFPARGPAVVTLVCIDREHRLKRGIHSRTFIDMKDSEIVSQLAGEAGLSADVEDTKVKHRYVFQNAQTNLSFIRERAMLVNYEVDVDIENSKLSFKPAAFSDYDGELKWGENLLGYSPRMSTEQQVSEVTVKAWSMETKKMLKGVAALAKIDYDMSFEKGAKLSEDHWGSRKILYTERPVHEQAEVDAMAVAYLNRLSMSYTEGQGHCQGDPKIDAGVVLTLDGVGLRSGGKIYVYKALHHFEPGVGYSTHFDFMRSTERAVLEREEPPPEPLPAREPVEAEKQTWVEFNIVSESGESLDGCSYKVTLPNGKVESGTLGPDQKIRVEDIRDPGDCQIEINQPEGFNHVG